MVVLRLHRVDAGFQMLSGCICRLLGKGLCSYCCFYPYVQPEFSVEVHKVSGSVLSGVAIVCGIVLVYLL